MNASIYKISLDIHKTISQTQLNIIKDDNKRRFVFTLYEDGKPYIISDNCTAVFRAVKPNGAIVFNNCEIVDNTIIYDLVNETSAVAGIVDCEVTLYGLEIVDGEPVSKQITSPRFTLHIEDNLYDDSQVEGEDEFTALETAIGQVLAALAATENLDVNVSKSGNTATVTVTHKDGTTRSVNIYDGADGKDGQDGITPDISATATVDSNVGTPSVDVTKSGTTENPSFAFAFSNLKGAKGDTGDTMQRTGSDLNDEIDVVVGEIYQCSSDHSASQVNISGDESFIKGHFYEYYGDHYYIRIDTQPAPVLPENYAKLVTGEWLNETPPMAMPGIYQCTTTEYGFEKGYFYCPAPSGSAWARLNVQPEVDISNKQDKTDNALNTISKSVVGAINEVDSIAKGANQAVSYASYSAMVTAINAMDDTVFRAGQNIMIQTLEVPDLWVYSVESTSSTYTYTTDSAIIGALDNDGYIQVGYYKLSALETQKVDLTDYYNKTQTDNLLNNKLDKATTPLPYPYDHAYIVHPNGTQGREVMTTFPFASAIPRYMPGTPYLLTAADIPDGADNRVCASKKYVDTKVPLPPTTDGTYKLTCVVANGEATYSWVAQ